MQLTIKTRKLPRRTDGVVWDNASECTHWACTLINEDNLPEDRELSFEFSSGAGHKGKAPTVKDVMQCLVSDAGSAISHPTFADFASEFEANADSIHAKSMYDKMVADGLELKRFLGDDEYDLAMDIGDDEYTTLRMDGEEALGWRCTHSTEWRPFDKVTELLPKEVVTPHRVRLVFGADLDFAEETLQDPSLHVEVQVQKKHPKHNVWVGAYDREADQHLSERERLFSQFRGFGVTTGPTHYVPNALYRYKQSIGLEEPTKDDLRAWERAGDIPPRPPTAATKRQGARAAFLRVAMHGLLESEPAWPSVTADEEGQVPLLLEEMVENMQVWLELRIPCMTDLCQKLMNEFGLPVDQLVGRGEGIAIRRRAKKSAARPRSEGGSGLGPTPKPKLLHTIVAADVGKSHITRACCGDCGKKQPSIHLSGVMGHVQKGDIGKRLYFVWSENDPHGTPIVQVESDGQLKKRLERLTSAEKTAWDRVV